MSDDLLAAYRKPSAIPAGGKNIPPAGTDDYQAFGTKDKVQRLRVHSALAPTQAVNYNILLNVISDNRDGTNFVLIFTIMGIAVRGRNLQKMVFAIENGMADYIQEFDPERWQKPKDANAAFIESIEIQMNVNGGSNAPLH